MTAEAAFWIALAATHAIAVIVGAGIGRFFRRGEVAALEQERDKLYLHVAELDLENDNLIDKLHAATTGRPRVTDLSSRIHAGRRRLFLVRAQEEVSRG